MAKGGHKAGGAPELKAALKLYEAGDVVGARREAKALLSGTPAANDKAQAEDLLARSQFPRMGMLLAGAAAVLISVMLLLALLRS